jgi:hypothetical protein
MSKVTITIDDSNPALVAAFGENSLEIIADDLGYMTQVEKDPSELPEKVTTTTPDGFEYLDYPAGTELYKPNPQTKAAFVGERILKENIVPRLLQGFGRRKESEALETVRSEVKQAEALLASVAEIVTE